MKWSAWSLFATTLSLLLGEGAARRLGKAMSEGSNELLRNSDSTKSPLIIERPPILYIRPMRDRNGAPIVFNNQLSFLENDTLPDFRKPRIVIVKEVTNGGGALPDFGQIIIEKTHIFRSRDLKGEFFVDYGNRNAGILPLASGGPSNSASKGRGKIAFPPFI